MIPLTWYLLVAALLFCIGLYGVMARRNAVAILMSVELMLNAISTWLHFGDMVLSLIRMHHQPVGHGRSLFSPLPQQKRPLVWPSLSQSIVVAIL